MKIGFVVARVGDERNDIQKLSVILADKLRGLGDSVDVLPFNRKSLLKLPPLLKLRGYNAILISNVGLQCAYYSLLKHLHLLGKPLFAVGFGSDIRDFGNSWINFFNRISVGVVDLLFVVNPDLEALAFKRGYKSVYYVPSWAGELT